LDAQGRVLLPQTLRDRVGLTKNVTVLGANNHAEFWDSEEWAALRDAEASPENIAAVMQELDF
jgi:MraZ protein